MNGKNKKTILLVEDEAVLAVVGKKSLEKYGYNVVTANSGESAIKLFSSNNDIDLVLMDIDLGSGIDGTETASIMLSERAIPVVFLSSHTEPEVVEKTEKITSYGYVVKNSGMTVLDASIKMAFKLFNANEKVNKHSARNSAIVQALPDHMFVFDNAGVYREVYTSGDSFLPVPSEKIIGKKLHDFFENDEAERLLGILNLCLVSGNLQVCDIRVDFDGRTNLYEARLSKFDRDHILALVRNVTDRRNDEEALRRSEEKYRLIFENSPLGLLSFDGNGVIEACNDIFVKIIGSSHKELTGLNMLTLRDQKLVSAVRNALNGSAGFYEDVYQSVSADKITPVRVLFAPIASVGGNFSGGVGIIEDITERRLAGDKLKQQFDAIEASMDGIAILDKNQEYTYLNEAHAKIYGYDTPSELTGRSWRVLYNENELKRFDNEIMPEFQNAGRWRGEAEGMKKDGTVFPQEISLTAVDNGGMICVVHDITGRKMADEVIRQKNGELNAALEEMKASNRELVLAGMELEKNRKALLRDKIFIEALLESIPGYLYVYDDRMKLVRWNKKHEQMTGYSADELRDMQLSDRYEGEDAARVAEAVREVLTTGYGKIEAHLKIKNGTKMHVQINGVRLVIDGRTYFTGVGIDITEQKRIEKRLKDNEERYRAFVRNATDIIFRTGAKGHFTFVNPAGLNITGYSESEITGMHYSRLITPDLRDEVVNLLLDQIRNRELNRYYEFRITAKDGREIWLGQNTQLIEEDGVVHGFQAVARDITDRIKLGKNLKESEEKYRLLTENSSDIIWHLDSNFIIDYISPSDEKLRGFKNSEVIGRPVWDLLKPEGIEEIKRSNAKRMEDEKRGIKTGTSRYEMEQICKDGKWVWTEINVSPHHDPDGKVVGLHGMSRDISERKRAEEKIKILLAEKEILLKEVHHRIKNNMNTIYSLLILQADTLKDNAAITALEDAASRIKSMMVLYDKLYNSPGFTEISLRDYIPSLADEILANFPNRQSVTVEKLIDDFVLDTKRVQPLGIIINELLTNVMKYAFTGRKNGEIIISASLDGNYVCMSIQDNGVGIPESVSFEKSTGFGLEITGMLARQLGGVMNIERGAGTKFVLRFIYKD